MMDSNTRTRLQTNPSLLREVGSFLLRSRKWYLIPIAFVLVLMCLLIVLGGTAAAPFVYTFW
jgi:hypothetical protein